MRRGQKRSGEHKTAAVMLRRQRVFFPATVPVTIGALRAGAGSRGVPGRVFDNLVTAWRGFGLACFAATIRAGRRAFLTPQLFSLPCR